MQLITKKHDLLLSALPRRIDASSSQHRQKRRHNLALAFVDAAEESKLLGVITICECSFWGLPWEHPIDVSMCDWWEGKVDTQTLNLFFFVCQYFPP